MILGITGHTKELGKHLHDKFSENMFVKGFSRSNGYDIKNPIDREKIIKEAQDCHVFINLVHNYYHQTDILFELFQKWENQEKLIINISTKVLENEEWGLEKFEYIEYKIQKQNLENMSKYLNKKSQQPKIFNYRITEINFHKDFINLNTIINEFKLSKK